MEAMEERLVARLRHHCPALTVTELRIGGVDHAKKNLVIEYLNSLRLFPNVESPPGLETVVSVDISSRIEQDEIFKKLLTFIRKIGIGDVSITNQPFDERQPEIESTESIQAVESSSRDYTPLNSDDIEELISRDKSESEFELILSQPRRTSSRESRRLRGDQSSMDVIGSLLRVSEGGPFRSSGWSFLHRSNRGRVHSSRTTTHQKPFHRVHKFLSRAKHWFKRERKPQKKPVELFEVLVSNDSIQSEIGKSKNKSKQMGRSIQRNIDAVTKPNKVSLNSLQKRLEMVSRDVFSMKNKCPGMTSRDRPSDAYTQTHNKTIKEADQKNTRTQTADKKRSRTNAIFGKDYIKWNRRFDSNVKSLSEMSVNSGSTDSEEQVMRVGAEEEAPPPMRGMVTNLFHLYPNEPADMKRPVMCKLKPVGGPFFFRRLTSPKTSSYSTTTSYLTTTVSNSVKSTRSTISSSSLSFPSISQEPLGENGNTSYENVVYTRSGDQYLSFGIASAPGNTPFERERLKKTQTAVPRFKVTQINTSEVFKLPKVTQTRPKKRTKAPPAVPKAPTVGTQTGACSSSTSCTGLLSKKSCGIKTENEVEKADKENSCHLLTKQKTETKETSSEALKSESCQTMTDKQGGKEKKSTKKQKSDRAAKIGFGWGQYPDGNFGFGQTYARGKVFPVISLATGFSVGNPFTSPAKMDKVGNLPCPKICNIFGTKKKALIEELNKQKMELMQMRMVLVAINEELLNECTDSSSEECAPSSDETCPSTYDTQSSLKSNKKVTFRDPLVNERIVK